MRHSLLVVVIALVLASCSGETVVSTTTTDNTETSTTSTTAPEDTTSTTRSVTTTTTPEPAIDIEIREGEITGTDRFRFDRGATVEITVLSDTAYELHVHGYDLRYQLEPEVPLTIEFTADIPGIFEVETHPDHLLAFEIEVGA